ncbi:D-alanyl-D-alanine carboxypeptidase/D-alanyl-D-alanine endopeptidase [Luteolibacter soli]|uniref:D-alanyl-D-alanine carboxypeptidase/D-alanyl-D-alanine-endopeptidase n=1 Tax=Luteolibacter soli TaxID=3135280 RepID=A0ABU9B1W6_9BACT
MKTAAAIGGIFAVAGWGVAAWLLVSKPLPSIVIASNSGASGSVARIEPEKSVPAKEGEVDGVFREWSSDPALAGALLGFCLLDENGALVFASPLASTALCPASALKTVTTATAFELLGPEFCFTTSLDSYSPIKNGVLAGDLYLGGDGDPTFSTADLEALVDELVRGGLKQVSGKIIVSTGSYFDGPVSEHWNWGDIGNAYGVGAFALNLDHNRLNLRFRPGAREGDRATLLDTGVATKDTKWINEVKTASPGSGDQVVVYSEPYGRTIRLQGTVPQGPEEFAVGGALPDPPARVEELLRARLEAAKVKILEQTQPLNQGRSVREELASHRSAPLPEIVDHLHKVSDNLEAQCLFHAIGRKQSTDPSWVIRRHWGDRGVEFKGLRMIDGNGLARADMIRPLDLAKVNHLVRRGPQGERFRQSLTAYLDGKVRAKLGAMSGVKTDVGFITMADGREFTFCLMANGLNPQLDYWPLRNKLLQQVAAGSGR